MPVVHAGACAAGRPVTARIPRLMIAAPTSGAGKTTLACALLAAMKGRGLRLQAFKGGPDYIDPMFHREVIGLPSSNLDLFLLGEEGCRGLLASRAEGADLAVIESAMGFYDGIADTDQSSGYALAKATQTPVILVVDARKAALSLAAVVHGFATLRPDANVCGVILNFASPALHDLIAPALTRETGLPVLGHLPNLPDCALESRHLGLVTASEVTHLKDIVDRLGAKLAETVDLDALLRLAQAAPPLSRPPQAPLPSFDGVAVAVAQDRAFCFAYPDALALLTQMGARLLPFSPLSDSCLPKGSQGLLLPGGYPELYAAQLAGNLPMRQSLLYALQGGLPCIAECGGFMVLHETLEDPDGVPHPMVGLLKARAFKTPRLQRFGYVRLTALQDTLLLPKGASVPAHEFHHWDSDQPGDALEARKPLRQAQWRCGVCTDTLFAGFPHLHLCADPTLAARFLARCQAYRP